MTQYFLHARTILGHAIVALCFTRSALHVGLDCRPWLNRFWLPTTFTLNENKLVCPRTAVISRGAGLNNTSTRFLVSRLIVFVVTSTYILWWGAWILRNIAGKFDLMFGVFVLKPIRRWVFSAFTRSRWSANAEKKKNKKNPKQNKKHALRKSSSFSAVDQIALN